MERQEKSGEERREQLLKTFPDTTLLYTNVHRKLQAKISLLKVGKCQNLESSGWRPCN